jgi:hypothetical protein
LNQLLKIMSSSKDRVCFYSYRILQDEKWVFIILGSHVKKNLFFVNISIKKITKKYSIKFFLIFNIFGYLYNSKKGNHDFNIR